MKIAFDQREFFFCKIHATKLYSVSSFVDYISHNQISTKQNFVTIFLLLMHILCIARAFADMRLGKEIPVWRPESHGKVDRGYGARSKGTQLFLPRGCKQEIFHGIKPVWDKRARSGARRPLVCIWKCNILSKFTRERYNLRQRSREKKLLQRHHHRGCKGNSTKFQQMSVSQFVKNARVVCSQIKNKIRTIFPG